MYTWDGSTGGFTGIIRDTNGEWGTSHPPVGTEYVITVSGRTLTITNSEEGEFHFQRVGP